MMFLRAGLLPKKVAPLALPLIRLGESLLCRRDLVGEGELVGVFFAMRCIVCAPDGRLYTQAFLSIRPIKSLSRSFELNVDFDPRIMSFERALVKATLIRRQSRRSSPTLPLSFERTSEITTISLSLPWNLSAVCSSIFSRCLRRCWIILSWDRYTVITPIELGSTPQFRKPSTICHHVSGGGDLLKCQIDLTWKVSSASIGFTVLSPFFSSLAGTLSVSTKQALTSSENKSAIQHGAWIPR